MRKNRIFDRCIPSIICVCFSLSAGSPADEVDLKIGDEIMEVNGEPLDGATHTEIIAHIHRVSCFILFQAFTFHIAPTESGN